MQIFLQNMHANMQEKVQNMHVLCNIFKYSIYIHAPAVLMARGYGRGARAPKIFGCL